MVHSLLTKFKKKKLINENTTSSLVSSFLLRNLSFFNIDLMTVTEKDNTIII